MKQSSFAYWCVGALGAIALHAGGAVFAYAHLPPSDLNADDGASAMEISMAFEAPKLEQTDLPPGPQSDASAAAAPAVEQTVKAEREPLPTETPTETEDPDRVVAREEVKDPSEKTPDQSQAQTQKSADSVAAEATAEPTIETATEAPKAVAPVQGNGRSAIHIRTTWQKRLAAHLDRNKRYPERGQRRSVQLVVAFTLDRVGHVVAARVTQSSGASEFDDAALAMMERADPVPPPPPLVADEGLTFTLPVIFNAKK
jgi:TonB family protein